MEGDNTCNKHDACISRINENINKIEISNAEMKGKIDGFTSTINDFVASLRKDLYAKDGLMDRVGNHGLQLTLQWGLIAALFLSICIGYLQGKK